MSLGRDGRGTGPRTVVPATYVGGELNEFRSRTGAVVSHHTNKHCCVSAGKNNGCARRYFCRACCYGLGHTYGKDGPVITDRVSWKGAGSVCVSAGKLVSP